MNQPPLTESQMQASINETNHAIVTSYIEAALAVGNLNQVAEHHLRMALAAQNL